MQVFRSGVLLRPTLGYQQALTRRPCSRSAGNRAYSKVRWKDKDMILSRARQLLLWSLGISFFVWACLDPRFRDAEGFLTGGFCLPVAVGVALMIVGWAVTGRMGRFAFWFAVALVGQAVALQMIEAGPLIHYQHYKPFDRLLTETHPLLLIYLVVQSALVVASLRTRWPNIRAWIGHTFKV